MSTAASIAGWVAAAAVLVSLLLVRRGVDARMEAVARACHELRGPITAARLGICVECRSQGPSPARLLAIDAELGRAALALQDISELRPEPIRHCGAWIRSLLEGRDLRAGDGACDISVPPRRIESVDVRELSATSVEAWHGSAVAAGTLLRWSWSGDGAAVRGDRLRLVQAVGNLIANAIEHGSGPIEVSGEVRGGQVELRVRDHGPGLPVPIAELTRRARRGQGERGRGLAIAAAVAHAHGGSLGCAPSPCGAMLSLVLPIARSPEPLRPGA